MASSRVEAPVVRPASPPGWLREDGFGLLLAEWTLCNIGQLGVVSILSLYLLTTLRMAPAAAGALLLLVTLTFRLARYPLTPLFNGLEPRLALLLSLAAAAAGYGAVSALPPAPLTLALAAVLVGAGYGSNGLVVKALAASRPERRLVRYSALNVAVNTGAAVGPLVETWLFLHAGPRSAFVAAAATFAVATLILLRLPPDRPWEPAGAGDWLRMLGHCLTIRGVRRAMVAFTGLMFLTSQLYAILPLAATRLLDAADLLGVYFAVNAVLVVVLQLPVTRLAARLAISPDRLIRAGFASYALGFLALWIWPTWQTAFAMVLCCSLAEVLVPPGIDSLMAASVPPSMRVSGFSLSTAAGALGEVAGVSIGVAAAGQLALHHELQVWYGILAAGAVAALGLAVLMAGRPSPALTRG
jgi:DHA1 family multidrug resistance protein-like MFS transporter